MSELLGRPAQLTYAAIIASGLLLGACSTETNHDAVLPTTTTIDQQQAAIQTYGPEIDQPGDYNTFSGNSPAISAELLGVDVTSDADYTKYVDGNAEGGSDKYMPLLRVELANGKLHLKDSSPHGIDPDLLSWFNAQFADQKTLISASLESGALKSVVIGLIDDKDQNPEISAQIGNLSGFFDPKGDTAVITISHNLRSIEAEQFKESLDHEVAHSLLSKFDFSFFSNDAISEQSQKEFIDACHSLRDTALSQADQHRQTIIEQLHQLANSVHTNPEWRQSVLVLADELSKGGLMQFQPEHEKDVLPLNISVNEKLPQCYTQDVFRMRFIAETKAGIVLDPTNKGMSLDALQNEIGSKFEDIQNNLYNLMRQQTIFSSLTDGTYTNLKAWGHPFDGADELGASSMSILLNYPRQLGANVRSLPSNQQQAIVSTLRIYTDRITKRYPDLTGLFSGREAEFLDALHN